MRTKKECHVKPPRCELIQLELPLEPPKIQNSPTLQISTTTPIEQYKAKETQVKMFADDRLDMTFLHFCVFLEIFACKLIDADKEQQFENHNAIQSFADRYAIDILKANLKNKFKK